MACACLTRLVLHLASACLYHICFALMGFPFFCLFVFYGLRTKCRRGSVPDVIYTLFVVGF